MPAAIILAGGKSSRMGQDKGLMDFRGKPMVQWVIDAVRTVTDDIILVANDLAYAQFGLPVWPDEWQDKGPVAGITTGLKHVQQPWAFVLSVDVPLLHPKVLNLLQSKLAECTHEKVILVKDSQGLHPLVGLYNRTFLADCADALARQELKLREIIFSVPNLVIDLPKELPDYDPHWLSNMNTPQDLRQADTIPIKLFGMLIDRMGVPTLQLQVPAFGEEVHVQQLIAEQFPALQAQPYKLAVDQRIVHGACVLNPQSEIVLLPPYAGG